MPMQNTSDAGCVPPADPMREQVLTQLQPFNEFRFDDCIAYLSHVHNRSLSLYEILKLHVMIDVYHTIDRAKPVIGGMISAFTNGPVSRSSKGRFTSWQKQYETRGVMPDGFEMIDEGLHLKIRPTRLPDMDDFSGSELSAMDLAWGDVVERLDREGFERSQVYFHRDSFIGKAWAKAHQCGRNISWDDIINEYDKERGTDHRE